MNPDSDEQLDAFSPMGESEESSEEMSESREQPDVEGSEDNGESSSEQSDDLSIGDLLRRERRKQDISLETVHEATKIPLDALRAIEEGYTVRTLSPFYYKGFVKIYAKFLGVDVPRALKEDPVQISKTKVDDFDDYPIRDFLIRFFTRRRLQMMVLAVAGLFAFFICTKLVGLIVHKKDKHPAVQTKQPAKVVVRKPGSEKPVASVKPETKPAVQPSVNPVASSQTVIGNVTLTVRAKKKSWLRVKEDGNVVFQSTLNVGSVETWAADEKIELSGNNLNYLEFEINGKLYGSLGRKDRKAKTLIVTKDGLKVQD